MTRGRIVVLYNTDYDAEQAANAGNPDATSVRESAKAIARALIETGYTVELSGVHGELRHAAHAAQLLSRPVCRRREIVDGRSQSRVQIRIALPTLHGPHHIAPRPQSCLDLRPVAAERADPAHAGDDYPMHDGPNAAVDR